MKNSLNKILELFMGSHNKRDSENFENGIVKDLKFNDNKRLNKIPTNKNSLKTTEVQKEERLYSGVEIIGLQVRESLSKLSIGETYYILKNNVSTLAIVIPILGVCIQTFQISRIHISYLRYFSATQVASDTIIAAIIVVPPVLYFLLFRQFYLKSTEEESLDAAYTEIKFSFKSKINPILIIGVYNTSYLVYDMIIRGDIYSKPMSYLFVVSGLLASLIALMMISYGFLKEIRKKKQLSVINGFFVKIYQLILYSYFIIILLLVSVLGEKYFEMTRIPYGLDNRMILEERIKLDYDSHNIESYEFLYFNDKYAFIEINSLDSYKSIRVYKTDEVLFNPISVKITIDK